MPKWAWNFTLCEPKPFCRVALAPVAGALRRCRICCVCLYGLAADFAGADTDRFQYLGDEDFTIANTPRARGVLNGL